MTGPMVVGHPMGAGGAAARAAAEVLAGGTLVWSDGAALREACDEFVAVGWDTLVVKGDDEGFSTAAMSHRAQVHGEPPVLIVAAADDEDASEVISVATMVARHLGHLPVVLVGDLISEWVPVQKDLELQDPILLASKDLKVALTDLIDIESLERRQHG
jgi:hypothetical protein